MRRAMDVVYLLHFASIATLLVGGFRLRGEAKGVRGYDVNPNFAKRVLSRSRAVKLALWGVLVTGLILALGGMEVGFMAARLFRRALPAGLAPVYVLALAALIAGALHPMVTIAYRVVPALMARPGNLAPEEAEGLVGRLRVKVALLNGLVLAALALGALRWLYASGILF